MYFQNIFIPDDLKTIGSDDMKLHINLNTLNISLAITNYSKILAMLTENKMGYNDASSTSEEESGSTKLMIRK